MLSMCEVMDTGKKYSVLSKLSSETLFPKNQDK